MTKKSEIGAFQEHPIEQQVSRLRREVAELQAAVANLAKLVNEHLSKDD